MKQEKSSYPNFWKHIQVSLDERRQSGLFREPTLSRPIDVTTIERGGRQAINFGSNDYLGMSWLANDSSQQTLNSTATGTSTGMTKFGAGASPLVTGYSAAHAQLVDSIAKFEGSESAVVFSSGYAANLGTIAAVAGRGDVIYSDALNHASLIDGCRLSRASVQTYVHSDIASLRQQIAGSRSNFRHAFVATDSVFSMDGDLAHLSEIVHLGREFGLTIILDEAHATGVLGENGRGLTEHLGLDTADMIKIGTLSKAIGCVGGFVAGSKALCQWLSNHARSWVYSTAPMPTVMFQAAHNLEQLPAMSSQRTHLRDMSCLLRSRLQNEGLQVPDGVTPIIPVYLTEPGKVVEASRQLMERGFYVPAIRPPTVPDGRSLLRISLASAHNREMVVALAMAIVDVLKN